MDVATLGGALTRPDLQDLALLSRYEKILAVFDNDPAGQQALNRYADIPRITPIKPPDHDLNDYWRSGGDLITWLSAYF